MQAMHKQELTPLPERLWALRNVAANMASSGSASSRAKAIEYQRKALELSRKHLGDAPHPGKMRDLWGCVLHGWP